MKPSNLKEMRRFVWTFQTKQCQSHNNKGKKHPRTSIAPLSKVLCLKDRNIFRIGIDGDPQKCCNKIDDLL